jgi:SAM-dependent methyltransferase
MATPTHGPRPTPERIFNTLTAFQQSAALKAAIELDIFTKIGEGTGQVKELAQQVNAAERGVRILCDYLAVLGFLTKDGSGYGLTQDSAVFLDRRSPACLGAMSVFLTSPHTKGNFDTLTDAIRKGGTASPKGDNTKPNDEVWVTFAKTMAPLTVPSANFIAQLIGASEKKTCRVLDIAAGHGMYGVTIAKQNPNAHVVAVDWPAVLQVAKENAQAAGLGDRFSTREGSAFETDLGQDYDFVLLTNIFHHFDQPTCEKLMRRVHAALKPGGKAVTLEFVPNEDRVTPPMAAGFSIIMLATTDSGDAYTLAEYDHMFRNAGFSKTSLHPVPEMPQQVLVSEKL